MANWFYSNINIEVNTQMRIENNSKTAASKIHQVEGLYVAKFFVEILSRLYKIVKVRFITFYITWASLLE